MSRSQLGEFELTVMLVLVSLGADAYGVIEQGKVDVLLQSSPRDRRAIFEEAAGISRFKAKKIESLRRLERVEQNLLRLSDIVEEVVRIFGVDRVPMTPFPRGDGGRKPVLTVLQNRTRKARRTLLSAGLEA